MTKIDITLTVNGEEMTGRAEPRMLASDFLREVLGLTGTHVGCEQGVCGACTIRLNGATARSCLLFAGQLEGADVTTVEGLGSPRKMHRIQEAFRRHHALQCGFCTPGFLMTVAEILETEELRTDGDIRDALSGNLCRCTGYEHIVRAVRELVNERDGVTA
ncbi:carbon-monoxide dehydrogenase small subunit [Roseovarius azorensis]|uniref:Carbon-monoxide dehydrogenase small subunit n=1 Tax=Roseovarius azorensis TaxID=1287727 RepID=A0A1H7XE71_9RHOB|nr:(2Fe-2S)-binding protein [Roseovarius azorensis]SEM32090.1 carbon-monoxide dehydrogenase small subunit [Roseovarius azorensis]